MAKSTSNMLEVRSRAEWRRWLSAHHGSVSEIWLVFYKGHTNRSSIGYDEAVEEAICFGWIDSLIKRLDDDRYARKFTPRKADGKWSTINRKRYRSLEARGLLAPPGLQRPPTNRSGDAPARLTSVPDYIEQALQKNPRAWRHFQALAPSYRRAYVRWIDSAKRDETRQKRLRDSVRLLAAGEKLGLK